MSSKEKKILKNIIGIIVFSIGTIITYNLFNNIHTNYCCDGLTKCTFFMCSEKSTKILEFEILGFLVFFCGAGVVFETIHLIKNIFKKNKKRHM